MFVAVSWPSSGEQIGAAVPGCSLIRPIAAHKGDTIQADDGLRGPADCRFA